MSERVSEILTEVSKPVLHYRRVDDRKNRRYIGVVDLEYYVTFPRLLKLEAEYGLEREREYHIVRDVSTQLLRTADGAGLIPMPEHMIASSSIYASNWAKNIRISVTLMVEVDKPSHIPDKHQIVNSLEEGMIDCWVRGKVTAAAQHVVRERNREADETDANHLLGWLLEQIRGAAKDVVRVDQRVAAIVAEYQSEVLRQLGKKDDELHEAITKAVAEGRFTQNAADVMWRWVRENAKELADDPVHRGIFGSSQGHRIKIPEESAK